MTNIKFKNIINEVTAKDMLQHAVNALTKTFGGKKLDQRYVKDYLKSIEQMARKNPSKFVKDYGKFKFADWIEDVEYNLQNEGKLNEGLSSSDIRKATGAIKAYVKKLGKKANGEAEKIASNIADILRWNDSKRDQLTDYLIKINNGDDEIIFGEGKLKESNKMIKFKDILKEAAWDRTSGKALPTLEDVQKAYNDKKHLQEELPIEEGDNTQYSWGQINKAFMAQGTAPKQILRFLSILKKQ